MSATTFETTAAGRVLVEADAPCAGHVPPRASKANARIALRYAGGRARLQATAAPRRLAVAAAQALIRLADHVATRTDTPNPMRVARIVLEELSDPSSSGGDFFDQVQWRVAGAGFTWPGGTCEECAVETTVGQDEGSGLCGPCGRLDEQG